MSSVGDELQFVAFLVGPQEFALNIFQVERILRYERPAALPQSPDFLEGIIRYAGGVAPVVDLRKRLQVPDAVREETRIMVLELEAQRIAIVVDQVLEVLRVDAAEITPPPPMVRGLAAQYISGIIARDNRTIVVLNAARLLSAEERLALATVEG